MKTEPNLQSYLKFVVFSVSIQQDVTADWIHLAPKSGFIFPEVKETTVSNDETAEIDTNSTTVKPKLETENEIQDKNSKPYFGPHVYFIVDKNHKTNKEMDRKKNALIKGMVVKLTHGL